MMESFDNNDDNILDTPFVKFKAKVGRVIQHWLDRSTIHLLPRWICFAFMILIFALRVYMTEGFYIIAYGLGIYLLNNFIAFLSPLEDPSADKDGPSLPSTQKEAKEYRPFARRMPEFKFWLSCSKATLYSILMTFFSLFDVPVFWPILLLYFFMLFFMTMKRQILHMYKHKYIPISFGKTKYKGKQEGMFNGGAAGSLSKGK